MGQDGQTFSLSECFQHSAESPDLLRTTELSKEHEQHVLFMGMGDGLALENAGLMSRNNTSDRLKVETERKKRDKHAYERALELMSRRLNDIQNEMIEIEQNIADSRLIIAGNESDIDFIRSLDTDTLYCEDGELRADVSGLLKKHGYDDLDGKSEADIRHIITTIEVQAIEKNDVERDKIEAWQDRHGALRREAQEVVRGHSSETHQTWANDLASRDPEILARTRLSAMGDNRDDLADGAKTEVLDAKIEIETQGFKM